MNSFRKCTILLVCIIIPIIGNCQKTIKRTKTPSKKESTSTKKNNSSKKNKISNVGKSLGNSNSQVPKYKKHDLINHLLSNMIYIEGGSFLMGSDDENALDWEKPIHSDTVSSYKIGKYEVTQQEWISIMDTNPSYYIGKNLPVHGASLDDCLEFIRRLNSLSGLQFRLPTEAEWEYAAKGGNNGKGFEFSGSNNIEEVAWYADNCDEIIHAVGMKKPNEIGIFDMSGNVWEWTSDRISNAYNYKRNDLYYVLRGGSWIQQQNDCRVTNRSCSSPQNTGFSYGFRLALDEQ